MPLNVEKISSNRAFGGEFNKYKFNSPVLGGTTTQFNVFIPAQASEKLSPVLYYFAGLTCNEDTGAWKGGFIRDAAEEGIALVFPDTSPRGAGVEGEDESWDFGSAAGFYINATNSKWSKQYNMYDHIVKELPEAIKELGIALDLSRSSLMGHSMGGHGALSIYLKNLDKFRSASAFSAIFNPSNPECQWGRKAFSGYLNGGQEEGKSSDATELIRTVKGQKVAILADYGDADKFYQEKQLLPENFVAAAKEAGFDESQVQVRSRPGYDHSYYFISTFAPAHIKFHAQHLREY
ncbi:hypothetical protein M407DRAFT_240924 [Tulasnella calospora MUT 4182]|uniref:S-formylglutathione hydrolase n=1 Tax=Tulasnella calospora MUT 4182 TaxID=1051891 RepID=A0A0C3QLT4_9AGAM|nr:hypothetical protein M407DRAFT_240924 [Tulasnella calospora MUT 4182]